MVPSELCDSWLPDINFNRILLRHLVMSMTYSSEWSIMDLRKSNDIRAINFYVKTIWVSRWKSKFSKAYLNDALIHFFTTNLSLFIEKLFSVCFLAETFLSRTERLIPPPSVKHQCCQVKFFKIAKWGSKFCQI